MKNIKVLFAFAAGLFVYALLIHNASCTREDAVIGAIEPPDFQYGDKTMSTSGGWNFDKAHSSALWETDYLGVSALLTGRFNTFSAQVNFDEDNPEATTFSGYVVLSSVNTGEPGRDQGCLLNTFGTTTISDTARLTSKKVEFDGVGGYIATADFDFHGIKKEVTMQLGFTGISHIDATAPYSVGGLTARFEINAKTDYSIVSTNISDRVLIRLNLQFKKPD